MTRLNFYRLNAQNRRQSQTFFIAVMLLGFALRMYGLGKQSLWYDETVSAYLAGLSATELFSHTARDIHPPGYYLLLHFWTWVAGNSEVALAFFSLAFGTLLIPLTYLIAKYLINAHVAGWTALLVATSPYNIWYSQEVRMYTLGAACGIVAAYCALHALQGHPDTLVRKYWAGYIVTAAVGLYALYYFSFLLIALNIFFFIITLWPNFSKQRFTSLLIANGLLTIAYLPWLPIAWKQATNPPVPPWRTPPSLWSITVESWSALSLGQSVEPVTVWPVLLLTLILLILGVYAINNQFSNLPPYPALFLLTYALGPWLLVYLLSFITPLYHVRYIFIYAPAIYILLGAGIARLATRTQPWVALMALLILIIASFYSIYRLHYNPRYQSDDYRAAVRFMENHRQPGDTLLTNAGYIYTAYIYYANIQNLERDRLVPYLSPADNQQPRLLQTGTINGNPQLGWKDPRSDFYATSPAETIAALEQLSKDSPRLWMLRAYDTVTDPTGLIRTWLNENAILLEDQLFSGQSNIRVQGYLLPGTPPSKNQSILFENGMALVDWHLPNQSRPAGQTIPLKFWWMATAPPNADYKLSLKLWTPDGQLAAQGQDEWPGGTLYRPSNWPVEQPVYHPAQITLPTNLPAGQYWLNVELYHPDTIQPLNRLDDGSAVVTLGPVQIK